MTRHRDTAWRAGHVLRGTRRQRLEDALAAERIHLWGDFEKALDAGEDGPLHGLVQRLRHMAEALGYPTPWRAVPPGMLLWYERVETCWPLGITAEKPDYDEVACEPWEIPSDLRWVLADPVDPFDDPEET